MTTPSLPKKLEDFSVSDLDTPTKEYINDVFTMPMSLAGLPTLSIPIIPGQPIGVQLVGQYGFDEMVLDFAEMIQ